MCMYVCARTRPHVCAYRPCHTYDCGSLIFYHQSFLGLCKCTLWYFKDKILQCCTSQNGSQSLACTWLYVDYIHMTSRDKWTTMLRLSFFVSCGRVGTFHCLGWVQPLHNVLVLCIFCTGTVRDGPVSPLLPLQLRTSLCCRPLPPHTCSSPHLRRWCHGE